LERRLGNLHSSGTNFDKSKPEGMYEKRAIVTWNLVQNKGKPKTQNKGKPKTALCLDGRWQDLLQNTEL